MTLKDFKAASVGKQIFVWVNWEGQEGDYLPMPRATFLRGIRADVPESKEGRCDGTFVRAEVRDGGIYVG